MKNLLTVVALVAMTALAWAQPVARTEEYCEFTLAGAFGSGGQCSIRLDDGQQRLNSLSGAPDKLRDENGRLVLFNSAVDALNYLNGYGWELFAIHGDSCDARYVMRRKLSASETADVPDEYQ